MAPAACPGTPSSRPLDIDDNSPTAACGVGGGGGGIVDRTCFGSSWLASTGPGLSLRLPLRAEQRVPVIQGRIQAAAIDAERILSPIADGRRPSSVISGGFQSAGEK